jgi:L-lactate permease
MPSHYNGNRKCLSNHFLKFRPNKFWEVNLEQVLKVEVEVVMVVMVEVEVVMVVMVEVEVVMVVMVVVVRGAMPDTLSSLVTMMAYIFCGRLFQFHPIHNENAQANLKPILPHSTAYICQNCLPWVLVVLLFRRKVESTFCTYCKFRHSCR